MDAVTTGTIGGERRAILCGESMIALEKGFNPIGWQIVLGIEPLGSMAITAYIGRDG